MPGPSVMQQVEQRRRILRDVEERDHGHRRPAAGRSSARIAVDVDQAAAMRQRDDAASAQLHEQLPAARPSDLVDRAERVARRHHADPRDQRVHHEHDRASPPRERHGPPWCRRIQSFAPTRLGTGRARPRGDAIRRAGCAARSSPTPNAPTTRSGRRRAPASRIMRQPIAQMT